MKFSILVPVYNVEEYLTQCLDSILAQTYCDFECILVDDGSTDNCGRICDDYSSNHPELFKVIHKQNEGLISARRVGIVAATGEYCIFVDSDDFIDANLLDTVNSYLSPDTDMAIYSFRYCENGGLKERNKKLFPDGTVFTEDNKAELYNSFISTHDISAIWIKAIRTELLKSDPTDYKPFYRYNMSEDIFQSIYPLTAAKRIVFINKPLYNYRINENSVSRSFRPETIPTKTSVHVYNAIMAALPGWELDDADTKAKLYASWFNQCYYTLCNYYYAAKTKAERNAVISFDWSCLLPDYCGESKEYCNNFYLKIADLIKNGKIISLNFELTKNKIYNRIKKI